MPRIEFPKGGLSDDTAFADQPGQTTSDAQNVRTIDPSTGRSRGGQRSGTSRFLVGSLNGGAPVQAMEQTMRPVPHIRFRSLGSGSPGATNAATGSITLNDLSTVDFHTNVPGFTGGDRITISDGTTSITFEASVNELFKSDPSFVSWTAFVATAELCMLNLALKINEQDFGVNAAIDFDDPTTVNLINVNTDSGASGNVAMVLVEETTGTWSFSGMSGGTTADGNTLEVIWRRQPQQSTSTLYTVSDANSNVWAVTDAGTAVLYNEDGRPVETLSPPVPSGHTILPRMSVAADGSIYLGSYSDEESRVWRYVRSITGYDQKWEIVVSGRVRELRENFGLLYVVTDTRSVDDAEYGGRLIGYAGLTLSTPFQAFSNECPMPVYSMAISPNGALLMAHPINRERGGSPSTQGLQGSVPDEYLWTPWDLPNYRERLFAWYRAEDALNADGEPCADAEQVVTLPDHRLSPPEGYEQPYDTTDRKLVKGERDGPLYRQPGTAGPGSSLQFDAAYTASGLAGECLLSGPPDATGSAKSSVTDTYDGETPIPSWPDSYYAICFAIRFPGGGRDATPQRVLWSQHDPASGTSGSSYGFVVGSQGGDVGSGSPSAQKAVWFDAGSDAGGTVNGGAHGDGSSWVNWTDWPDSSTADRVAIVTIVKGNTKGDGKQLSVFRVNGRQVDVFELEEDLCDGQNSDRFILGCRRAGNAEAATFELYTDSYAPFESFKGQFFEMITILGDSDGGVHNVPVTCPIGGNGAAGSGDSGNAFSKTASVPTHVARLAPSTATEIELIEGYLAHKYGAPRALGIGTSPGAPRDEYGYYDQHPFGGPGFYPESPAAPDQKYRHLYSWPGMTTLWTAGGSLSDSATGSGHGVGVGADDDGRVLSAGVLQFLYTEARTNEKDVGFRRMVVQANQLRFSKAAYAQITIGGIPPNNEAITLTDGINTETFEFETAAASPGNIRVDTNVTPTVYQSDARLVALALLDAIDGSGLNISGFLASAPEGSNAPEHSATIYLFQDVVGSAKNLDIIITSAGTVTGDSAFAGGQTVAETWRARSVNPLESLSDNLGDGVELRSDRDGNIYHPDKSYLSQNGIVRRSASNGSVQWRYLFPGDSTAQAVSIVDNPPTYAGSDVDGPEFIYAGITSGAADDFSLFKLRLLEVTEDLTGDRSSREAVYLGVCGGSIVRFVPNGDATVVTGGENVFSDETPYVQTAVLGTRVFFTDGLTAHVYDAEDGRVTPYESQTKSSYPRRFRLIASWRNRLVVARIPGDDTNWYMSRSGDPFDWDEAPPVVDAQQPVSGNTSKGRIGRAPDVINSLIPWSDDLLIIGGDRSIWRMTGDPMQGAQVDLVSDSTGVAFLSPWCKDPNGTLYFFGSRGGVWVMPPGGMPQRITISSIERRMRDLDLGDYKVQMVWNYYDEGLHVIPVPYDLYTDEVPVSWFFDAKHGAWWEDTWQDSTTSIRSVLLADGDRPDDRRVLFGCKDGRVRYVDPASHTDDGVGINSHVLIGPLLPEQAEYEARFTGLTAVLGTGLGPAAYEVLVGDDAESAEVVGTGIWRPGRNPISMERWTGPCAWIRVRAGEADAWAMESMHVRVHPTSRKRIK